MEEKYTIIEEDEALEGETLEERMNGKTLSEAIKKPRTRKEQLAELKMRETAHAIDIEIEELEAQALVAYNRAMKYKDCQGRLYAKAKEAAAVYDAMKAEIEEWRALKRQIYKSFFRCFAKWRGQLYAAIVSTYVFITTDWKYIADKYKVSTRVVVAAINDYQYLRRKAKRIKRKSIDKEGEEVEEPNTDIA